MWATDASGEELFMDLLVEPGDYSDLLMELVENPIDLNTAGVNDLLIIPWLTLENARLIVDFRRRFGGFRSVDDLLKVQGLSADIAESLLPYVTVAAPSFPGVELRLRFRKKSSVEGGGLVPLGIYQRALVSVGRYCELGLIVDKDPEEKDPIDFIAGYAEVEGLFGIDRIVVGDYRPGFGQGLLFSRWSMSMTDPDFIKKKESRFIGYRSSDENGALRGLFLSGSAEKVGMSLFLSRSRFDASLNDDGTLRRRSFSGYHVTEGERAKKDALTEELVGGRVTWGPLRGLTLGFTAAFYSLNPPFREYGSGGELAFEGSSNGLIGLDWDVEHHRVNLFGEAAYCRGGGRAGLFGITSNLGKVNLSLLARGYGRAFHSFHGSAFSASSGEFNGEAGVFTSLSWRPSSGTRIAAYYDRYRYPSRKYKEKPMLHGGKFSLSGHRRFGSGFQVGLRYRFTHSRIDRVLPGKLREEIRFDAGWGPGHEIRLRGRAERVIVGYRSGADEDGTSVFGDLRVGPVRSFTLSSRFTFFETDSYDSRIYEFEDDHRGVTFARSVYGKGKKWYVLIKKKIGDGALSAKFREFKSRYKGIRRRSEFSVQLDVKF